MTNILRFGGSVELSPEQAARLAMGKDFNVEVVGEIRAIVKAATDTDEEKVIYRLRVSEVKVLE
jgi:hypothetical protein